MKQPKKYSRVFLTVNDAEKKALARSCKIYKISTSTFLHILVFGSGVMPRPQIEGEANQNDRRKKSSKEAAPAQYKGAAITLGLLK